jgi:uncharacterized protein (UPF0335 family)
MSKTAVDLLELSDSQKTEFLKSTRAYLKQQVEEKRYCNSVSLSSLEKDNTGLEYSLPIKGIDEMSNLKSIIEKIRSLEEEKKNLVLEIEELKKLSEAKATALESEVNALREEVKSLKTLMTELEPKADRRLKK